MQRIAEMLLQIIFMFLIVVALHGTALGDVAPPPPDIPGTNVQMPEPSLIVLAGVLMSVAILWTGRTIARRQNKPAAGTIAAVAVVLLALGTIVSTVYAHSEITNYQERRSNYRSPGPPRRLRIEETKPAVDIESNLPEVKADDIVEANSEED